MAEPLVDWTISLNGKEAEKSLDGVKAAAKETAREVELALDKIEKSTAPVVEAVENVETGIRALGGEARKLGRSLVDGTGQAIADSISKPLQPILNTAPAIRDITRDVSNLKRLALGSAAAGALLVRSSASAGFQDTAQGQQSQVYGQLLNRQVALIFAPMLEERTRWVSRLTATLQNLTEPQRAAIRTTMAFTTAFVTLRAALPIATRGLYALAGAAATAAAAQRINAGASAAGAASTLGPTLTAGAMGGPVGIAVATVGAGLLSTENGREALGNALASLQPIFESLATVIESLTPAFDGLAKVVEALTPVINTFAKTIGLSLKVLAPFAPAIAGFVFAGIPGAIAGAVLAAVGKGSDGSKSPRTLSPAPRGFEDIEQAFIRINEAAVKQNFDQMKVDLLRRIAVATEASAGRPNPAGGNNQPPAPPAIGH